MIIKAPAAHPIAWVELTAEGPCRVGWKDGRVQLFGLEGEMFERVGLTVVELMRWAGLEERRSGPQPPDFARKPTIRLK